MVNARGISMVSAGLLVSVLVTGCHLWPMMSNEDGRRPEAMGKSDQVLYPYNPQPVHLSEDYGQSYNAARENQILNPQASQNLEPVVELDGAAGKAANDRYRKMFKKPPYGGKSGKGGGGSK